MADDGSGNDGKDGHTDSRPLNFMARLEAAGAKARSTPAPWDQLLTEQAKLRKDLNDLRAKLRSIEEGVQRLTQGQRRAKSLDKV